MRYFGGPYWLLNFILDRTVREEDEKVTNAVGRDASRDFYGQLSQIIFNARARLSVLRAGDGAATAGL